MASSAAPAGAPDEGVEARAVPPDDNVSGGSAAGIRQLQVVEATDVEERPIDWEWRRRLVRAALDLIEGDPEAGKTAIVLDLLARKSRGAPLPDGEVTTPTRVLIVGSEDAIESVVKPRLRVAGADLGHIRFVTGVVAGSEDHFPEQLKLPKDLALLALALADRDLLYVDGSVNDYAERGVRPGDDIAMRELLGGLHELARRTHKTVLAGRHLRKGGSTTALEAGSGTMGIAAKARAVLGVYRDPRDPEIRLLARVKCNVAPPAATLRARFYSDEPDSPLRVEWLGEDDRSANEILADIRRAEHGGERDHSAASKALADWLRDGQPKAVSQLQELAKATRLSWAAFRKAKDKMGIESEPLPGGGWTWRDPFFASRQEEGG